MPIFRTKSSLAINQQKCGIWSSENSQMVVEEQMHPQPVTVWYELYVEGIIRPVLFKNAAFESIAVNSAQYRGMTIDFLAPKL